MDERMGRTAEEVLEYMKELLEVYLAELNGYEKNAFAYGEKTAYVECLEVIQLWEKAQTFGLDYDIEPRYPI